ncbi:MAG: iron ABC transporter permease [Clostridia bacterium]|nr:iron ABC transporter permease [Clostridia bacterium]
MKNNAKFQKAAAITAFIAVALVLIILIICPLVSILSKSFITDGKLDWSNLVSLFSDSGYLETIGNSLLLGLSVTVISTVISLPLAFLFSRTKLAKLKWMDIIFMIPFMTPPYISAMGWTKFLAKRGYLQQIIPAITNSQNFLYSFWGLSFIMALHVFPFMYTMMKNALLNVPSALDEAAAVSGGSFFYRLRRVYAPLLLGNYAIAAILVFIKTLSEYGTPAVIGNKIGFYVFTTSIHNYTSISPVNFGMAAMLSVVLTLLCFILWLAQNHLTNKKTYKVVSGKGVRVNYIKMPWYVTVLAWIYIAAVLITAIGVPYFSVIATSLLEKVSRGLSLDNLTFANYAELFSSGSQGLEAISISLELALLSATIASVLGIIICTLSRNKKRKYNKVLEATGMLPEMLPSIVLVLGIMLFWNSLYNVIKVYNTLTIMVLAYTALFLPYSIQYITSAFTQFSDNLPLAGRITGGSKPYVFMRITLPLIAKGIITGWMMIFIISFRELVAASMLEPTNTYVISTYIWRQFEQGSSQLGMCMAVICLIITVVVLIVVRLLTEREKKSRRK